MNNVFLFSSGQCTCIDIGDDNGIVKADAIDYFVVWSKC